MGPTGKNLPIRVRDPGAEARGRVLVVDDQAENLDLVEEILAPEGYAVARARDGKEALEAVAASPPDCIVLDIMMPQVDGYAVCRQLKGARRTCFIPVIMLTALAEVSDKVMGLEAGADDFLNKPVHAIELLARVRSLVRVKRMRDDLDDSESVIMSMVRALEMKDRIKAGHSERIALWSIRLARRLGLTASDLEVVAKGAMLHDLGKIGLPDHLLLPRGATTADEQALVRSHPEMGAKILEPLASLRPVAQIILRHHERLDGSGFPGGLAGTDLPLPVEIVALANHFDDLVYRLGDLDGAAQALLRDAERGLFHRDVAETFVKDVVRDTGGADQRLERWEDLLPVPVAISPHGTVLVGDDTPANREVIEEILRQAGHDVVSVGSGEEVLDALESVRPDLVLLDIRMPGLDGFEVCRRIREAEASGYLPVILVTAFRDSGDRAKGALTGADEFLLLPLNRAELTARVRSLLRLRDYLRDLEQHPNVIRSLAAALEAKDPYTRGHSRRVGDLAARLAARLGHGARDVELLRLAGELHDIGKIGIPERLLNKPGRFTHGELQAVMRHPEQGETICRHLRSAREALPVIRHHHEKLDGSGYPDRLKGEAIPLGARILGLADAYEAMVSRRAYRAALSETEAVEMLRWETACGRWDPRVFEALAALLAEGGGAHTGGEA